MHEVTNNWKLGNSSATFEDNFRNIGFLFQNYSDIKEEEAENGGGDDDDLAHSCTRFPCYLGMEINAETQWTTTKIVELGN